MLDPRRLLTFRAVAEAGSFSAAARELSLTQPAVSQQVAALERELGARLLHRGPGGLTLTEAGTVALDHAQAVAERLALADAQLAELGDDRGALRVGGFPSALATLVPAAIASVVPQRVEAVEGTVEQLAAGVADGSLHVAVLFQDAAAPRARAPRPAPPRAARRAVRHRRRPRAPARAAAERAPARARRRPVGGALRRPASCATRASPRASSPTSPSSRATCSRSARWWPPGLGVTLTPRLIAGHLHGVHALELRDEPPRRALYALTPRTGTRARRARVPRRVARRRCKRRRRSDMRRRRTVGALAAVLALACASAAHASSIVYVCAPNLCRIDPAHPKKVTRLTRDGKASGPGLLSPSLSTKGTKLTFVKGNRLYLAQGNATRARQVDEPAGSALARMRPDGRQVALHPQRQHDHLAGLHLPVLLAAGLRLRALPLRARRGRRQGADAGALDDQHGLAARPRAVPARGRRQRPAARRDLRRRAAGGRRALRAGGGDRPPAAHALQPGRVARRALSRGRGRAVLRRPGLQAHLRRRAGAVQPGDGRVPARPDARPGRRRSRLLARRQAGRLHARRQPLRRRGGRAARPSSCAAACGTRRGARASARARGAGARGARGARAAAAGELGPDRQGAQPVPEARRHRHRQARLRVRGRLHGRRHPEVHGDRPVRAHDRAAPPSDFGAPLRVDQILLPEGVAVGPDGNVYVVEAGSTRSRVSVWTPTGAFVRGFGDHGSGPGQLDDPKGVAVDGAGFVYVADSGNSRVERFTPGGQFAASIGQGLPLSAGPDQVSAPEGVAIAPDGSLFVSDQQQRRVQRYAPDGAFLGSFGSQGSGDGQFQATGSLAAAPDGALYVADWSLSSVQRFTAAGLRRAGRQRRGQRPRPVLASVLPRGRLPRDALRRRRRQRPHPAPRRSGRAVVRRPGAGPQRAARAHGHGAHAAALPHDLRRRGGRGVRPPVHGEGRRQREGRRAPARAAPARAVQAAGRDEARRPLASEPHRRRERAPIAGGLASRPAPPPHGTRPR